MRNIILWITTNGNIANLLRRRNHYYSDVKGEIKTETELKTLLENRGGKNFAERIFIESCVNQISNKSLQRLHAALK